MTSTLSVSLACGKHLISIVLITLLSTLPSFPSTLSSCAWCFISWFSVAYMWNASMAATLSLQDVSIVQFTRKLLTWYISRKQSTDLLAFVLQLRLIVVFHNMHCFKYISTIFGVKRNVLGFRKNSVCSCIAFVVTKILARWQVAMLLFVLSWLKICSCVQSSFTTPAYTTIFGLNFNNVVFILIQVS